MFTEVKEVHDLLGLGEGTGEEDATKEEQEGERSPENSSPD